MNTAEEVQKVSEIQDQLIVKEFGIQEITTGNIALMKSQILEIPEKPETKEQYQSAYQFNVDAKKLLPRIEDRRKELKAPVLEKCKAIDDTAKKAKAMVKPLIELSGSRRQAWEDEKAAEKAEKERIETSRLAAIQAKFDMLNHLAAKPIEYNRPAEDIARDIAHLEAFEISVIDFQEKISDADLIKSESLITAKNALENRKKFEADQAEAARVKAENEEAAKRLAEEQAKIEADRKSLEKEKAEASQAAIIAEREAVWDIAHIDNFNFDHAAAIIENNQYDGNLQAEMDQARADAMTRWEQTEAAKKAKAERLKLIGPDKLIMQTIADDFDKWVTEKAKSTPAFNTSEATAAFVDLISRFKSAVDCFEKEGEVLK